jgi:6-phosphogluconolactonase
MKGNSIGRGLKAAAVSLAIGLGLTACSRDYTVAYLYVTSATKTTAGVINAYSVDFQSGALEQLADSPIPAGNNPVALVAAPNAQNLYVVNRNDSTVIHYDIGTDGKLYPETTTNVVQGAGGIVGSFPVAAAIDPTGKFLYVIFTYQNGFTTARPGPGGIAIFPIDSSGNLGAALTQNGLPYIPVGNNPTAITVNPKGGFLYVVDREFTPAGSPFGVLLAYSANTTTGALTQVISPGAAVGGPVTGGFAVGTSPSSIVEEPAGLYVYVTDSATNQLFAFQTNSTGAVQPLTTSPYATGLFPVNVTVDPRGQFLYVANFGSSTVSAYTITGGSPSSVAGSATVATGPNCVTIEPALGIYLFTSNNTDGSVSAEQLDPHSGSLKTVQGSQFSAAPLPTCAVAVANGAHATQIVH